MNGTQEDRGEENPGHHQIRHDYYLEREANSPCSWDLPDGSGHDHSHVQGQRPGVRDDWQYARQFDDAGLGGGEGSVEKRSLPGAFPAVSRDGSEAEDKGDDAAIAVGALYPGVSEGLPVQPVLPELPPLAQEPGYCNAHRAQGGRGDVRGLDR